MISGRSGSIGNDFWNERRQMPYGRHAPGRGGRNEAPSAHEYNLIHVKRFGYINGKAFEMTATSELPGKTPETANHDDCHPETGRVPYTTPLPELRFPDINGAVRWRLGTVQTTSLLKRAGFMKTSRTVAPARHSCPGWKKGVVSCEILEYHRNQV